jgi:hypothetical protein
MGEEGSEREEGVLELEDERVEWLHTRQRTSNRAADKELS